MTRRLVIIETTETEKSRMGIAAPDERHIEVRCERCDHWSTELLSRGQCHALTDTIDWFCDGNDSHAVQITQPDFGCSSFEEKRP